MGKSDDQQLPLHQQQGRRSRPGGGCPVGGLSHLFNRFNFKCFFVLLLSVSVFLSAAFSVLPLRPNASGFDAKEAIKLGSTVQAYIRLKKPVSDLIHSIDRLEYDIYGEIGVPSTKVAILSMHQADLQNESDAIFGVLPDQANSSINQQSLDLLKMLFIDLFLKQANLTLTTSIFGEPYSFEILKFPNGMTIIPEPLSPFWDAPQILFNFTLHNSVEVIKENYVILKEQLKSGLHLKPHEEVFVMVKNKIGSTRDPPVTIEVSAVTDVDILPPERLKQLARTITRSPPSANLGLDNSIFGKVKQISLSSFLSHSLQSLPPVPAPASAPTHSPFPSPPYASHQRYGPLPGDTYCQSPPDITASPPIGPGPSPAGPVLSYYFANSPLSGDVMLKMSPSLSPLPGESYHYSRTQEKWVATSFGSLSQISSASSSSPSVLCWFLTMLCWI
ncbi:hypothetical protein DM860_003716 [Cuscuta australis]|uniref:DUF7036 domain-containing protein n=1 Tax=Cuscuta australis TaxID=267555 RepID=A0A328DGV9_9ASTE|nr:hypothetical protein DM860_003716 [Cuscuta australis]